MHEFIKSTATFSASSAGILKIWTCIALGLSSLQASGQSEAVIGYDDFVRIVSARQPERSLWHRDVEIATTLTKKSGVLPDPMVSVMREGIPIQRPHDEMFSETMPLMWEISISQDVPWPGTLSASRNYAEANAELAKLGAQRADELLRLNAGDFFLRLAGTSSSIAIERAGLDEVERISRLAESRFRQGIGSHKDVLQSKIEIRGLTADIATQEAELQNLQAQAAYMLGMQSSEGLKLDYSMPAWISSHESVTSEQPPPTDLTVASIQLENKAKRAQLDSQYRMTLPMLMANGTVARTDEGMTTGSVMVGITVPIFSSIPRRAISSEKNLVERQISERFALHERELQLAKEQNSRRIERGSANLALLRDDLLPLAREHLQATLTEYGQGRGSAKEVIDARRTLLRFEQAEIVAMQELGMARLSKQKLALGITDGETGRPIVRAQWQTGMPMSEQNMEMGRAGGSAMREMIPANGASRSNERRRPSPSGPSEEMPNMGSGGGM